MNELEKWLEIQLFALQDLSYKDFQTKLVPNLPPESIIGVRMPALRKFARDFMKTAESAEFLKHLPHRYYEENNLHGLLLSGMRNFSEVLVALDVFLPYVDNWATCDLIHPKVFGKHLCQLLPQIRVWLASDHPYTVRFGIGMLMRYYLDAAFSPEYPQWVAQIRSEDYYVNMMVAWYFATALAKQYIEILPYLESRKLAQWTHNKAIQKACESYRICEVQKKYLCELKWKKEDNTENKA